LTCSAPNNQFQEAYGAVAAPLFKQTGAELLFDSAWAAVARPFQTNIRSEPMASSINYTKIAYARLMVNTTLNEGIFVMQLEKTNQN
jgi:hypothetical protein